MMNADAEACSLVEKELDRVISKFTAIRESSAREISDATTLLEEILQALAKAEQDVMMVPGQTATTSTGTQVVDGDDPIMNDEMETDTEMNVDAQTPAASSSRLTNRQIEVIAEALQKTNEKLQLLSTEHRDLHGAVSKVGKVIDRNFVSDFTATTRTDALANEENLMLLNKVAAKHYCRQGMADVAQLLIKESKMPEDMALEVFESESSFAEIYKIWKDIQTHELGSALDWTARFSEELLAKNSALEFKLHRLAFLQLIERGMDAQAEAISYARKNFSKFGSRFEQEIPRLMGCFIFLPVGIENSPYKHLITPEAWTEASYIFMKDACQTLGISKNSALSVVINAGSTALPALLNIKQVMQSRQVLSIWNGRDELPIEIDLDPEYRYHSVFACPILRQQTTEENPPKKLTCGHVISNDALHKLSNGHILKCPYCPVEQNADDAVRIYF